MISEPKAHPWRSICAAAAWMWAGFVIFFAAGVTRVVFRSLREDAGRILQEIFPQVYLFSVVAALGVIVSAWFWLRSGARQDRQPGPARWALAGGWIGLACNLVAWLVLEPRLHGLDPAVDAAQFGLLHGLSLLLMLVSLLGAVLAGVVAVL